MFVLVHPAYLRPGDAVHFVCPSGFLPLSAVEACAEQLRAKGFRTRLGRYISTSASTYFSAVDEHRLSDLQNALDHTDTAVIVAGRGGYGLSRIMDNLDWTGFRAAPKWICGFSDITLLHLHVQTVCGVQSLHAPMVKGLLDSTQENISQVLAVLQGGAYTYPCQPFGQNRSGEVTGVLVGGNLSLLTHAIGTPSFPDLDGCILFLEDVGEHLYRIDRMLWQLKRAGKIEALAGVILGSFSELADTPLPFGKDIHTILTDIFADYSYPVALGLACGHTQPNVPLRLGAIHRLTVCAERGAVLALQP